MRAETDVGETDPIIIKRGDGELGSGHNPVSKPRTFHILACGFGADSKDHADFPVGFSKRDQPNAFDFPFA